jgi:hypothetical protein
MKYDDGFGFCVGDNNAIHYPLKASLIPNAILSHQTCSFVLLLNSLLGMSKEQDCPRPKTTMMMMKLGKVEDKVKP